jgi:hypothetical protein
MNSQTDSWIDAALDDLAAADAHVVAPAKLKTTVLHAWDEQRRTAAHPEGIRQVRWPTAAAWVLVPAAAVLVVAIASLARDPAAAPDRGLSARDRPTSSNTGYVIVPEPFSDTALHVVRVRMARMALATLGMPIADPDAEGLVDVEILVGDDGVARSIRNATFVGDNTETGAER